VRQRIAAEQEERCVRAFVRERIKHAQRGDGPWAVIEGEHDFLGRERQCLRELLEADARRRAGVHRENARRAQRIRIAGAGDLLCPRERGAKRKRRGGGRALHDPWSPHPIIRN
jgi:hypothetical protein